MSFTIVPRPPILMREKRRKGVLQTRMLGVRRRIIITLSGSEGMSLLTLEAIIVVEVLVLEVLDCVGEVEDGWASSDGRKFRVMYTLSVSYESRQKI